MQKEARWRKLPWMHIGAFMLFVFLVVFDFKVAFHGSGQATLMPGITVGNSQAQARPYQGNGLGKFVVTRSDVWNCYKLRTCFEFSIDVLRLPYLCQDGYAVVVQTESCRAVENFYECAPGAWKWSPNPPCGGDSPTGWYLPPC